jgi:hypothetical protein
MLSLDVIELLENWQFRAACDLYGTQLDGDSTAPAGYAEHEMLLDALSRVFGSCGVFPGDMGVIVAAAVSTLLPPDDEW